MYLALLKKEFLQFFRSKSNVILLFIFPIVLITTLGFGLNDIMESAGDNLFSDSEDTNIIYYSEENEQSMNSIGFKAFADVIKDEFKFTFKKEELNNVKNDIDDYNAIAFVKITDKGYDIYTSEKGDSTKSKIFTGMIQNILDKIASNKVIANNASSLKEGKLVQSKVEELTENYVIDVSDDIRHTSATEYYTFAELALIILYIATVVGESVYKENQLTTINRIRLSKVSEGMLILSKVTTGVIIGIMQTIVIYIYSTFALDVHWGDYTIKFGGLYLSLAIFASMAGALVGVCAKKDTTVNAIINTLIVVFCALGGAYTPIFTITSNPLFAVLSKISPVYWITMATNSVLSNIESNTYIIALIYPIIAAFVMLVIYLIVKRKRGALSDV